jgi:hypothetical protein
MDLNFGGCFLYLMLYHFRKTKLIFVSVCDFRQNKKEVRLAAGHPCGRVAGARSTWTGHQLGRSQGPQSHGCVCVRPQPQRHRVQGGHPQSWRRNSRGESALSILSRVALECDPLYFTDCSRLSANSIKAASCESKVIVFANKVRNCGKCSVGEIGPIH